MAERLLSVHVLSDLIGWSPFTIYRKARMGEIPGRVKLGTSLRFRECEIQAWIEEKARSTPAVNKKATSGNSEALAQ